MSFELIEMTSFWSVWYWVVTVVAWSMTAHWTLGVPYDLVMAANRDDEIFAGHCDTMVYINIYRIIYYFSKGGPYFIGFVSFFLTVLATLGFYSGYEFAMALFMLLGPLTIPMAFSVRLAYWIDRVQPLGEELRRVLRRRRLWNQVTGMFAIIMAMAVGIYHYLDSLGLFDL